MNFNAGQIAKVAPRPKTPPNANDWRDLFAIRNEDTLAGMFGKQWTDEDRANRPAGMETLWSSLFASTIGRDLKPTEIPAVLSCASQVSNPDLARRCLSCLEAILRDDKLNQTHHQLFADAERVVAELKAKHPKVLAARDAAIFALRERHLKETATPND
jgi:hypothetical protein